MSPQEESRHWFYVCPKCGAAKSVAECGGKRYRARRTSKRVLGRCDRCAKALALKVEWRPPSLNDRTQEDQG